MNPLQQLQGLWQQIQQLKLGGTNGSAPSIANPMAQNPAQNPAGASMSGAGMSGMPTGGSGFSLQNDAPNGQFGTNLPQVGNPNNYSLTGPATMNGGAPATGFGASVNPTMAPSTAATGTPSLPMPTPSDPTSQAMKLMQYAAASKALQNLQEKPNKPYQVSGDSFRMKNSGGSGFGKDGSLAPAPVGMAKPPQLPVTSAGTFLLSPAGKRAMAMLQATMQPNTQMAA